jgi:prepilin signal peptidase PulO-like enzyme (type II secretory pathway)
VVTPGVLCGLLCGRLLAGLAGLLLPGPWRQPLGVRYVGMALATAALWGLAGRLLPRPGPAAYAWALAALAVLVAATDIERRLIPDRALLGAALLWALLWWLARPYPSPLLGAAGAVAFGGVFLAAHLAWPEGMGMGDAKLAAVLGLYLGWPLCWVGLALGAWAGGAAGLVVLLRTRGDRRATLPYGPFLAAGAVAALLLRG